MESWRTVWRDGFAPGLPTAGLVALRRALETDDPRLRQGATTVPAPLHCLQDYPCEGACAVSFAGWQDEGGPELTTVGQVEEFFAKACYECDRRLGEPAACRWFLNWFDDAPRDELRREMLVEVERVLKARTEAN